jgi:hypothetical protein
MVKNSQRRNGIKATEEAEPTAYGFSSCIGTNHEIGNTLASEIWNHVFLFLYTHIVL